MTVTAMAMLMAVFFAPALTLLLGRSGHGAGALKSAKERSRGLQGPSYRHSGRPSSHNATMTGSWNASVPGFSSR
jgi:hypothetical protein